MGYIIAYISNLFFILFFCAARFRKQACRTDRLNPSRQAISGNICKYVPIGVIILYSEQPNFLNCSASTPLSGWSMSAFFCTFIVLFWCRLWTRNTWMRNVVLTICATFLIVAPPLLLWPLWSALARAVSCCLDGSLCPWVGLVGCCLDGRMSC